MTSDCRAETGRRTQNTCRSEVFKQQCGAHEPVPRNLGFLSTTSLISPTSSMLVYRTAIWTLSGSRTTCCNTSDSVGLFSLKDKPKLSERRPSQLKLLWDTVHIQRRWSVCSRERARTDMTFSSTHLKVPFPFFFLFWKKKLKMIKWLRYSRINAFCNRSHDEEDGLRHLPGRVPFFQRRI